MINTLVERVCKSSQGREQGAAEVTLGELGKQNIQGEIEVNQMKRNAEAKRQKSV